jgi:ribosome-binding factor A
MPAVTGVTESIDMARHNESAEGRSVRLLRVGEQVRHALSEILMRGDVHDEVLASHTVSITEVRMSPDLRHATVFVKPLLGANEAEVLGALKRNVRYLRGEVSRRVNTKYAADLKFLPDESFEEGSHIDALLSSPEISRDLDRRGDKEA